MNQNLTKDMTCQDYQILMEEYIAGELDSHMESEFTAHLNTCDSCQHELGLAQVIDTVLDDLPKPTTPPDILREVTTYVQTHSNNRHWMHRFFDISTFWDIVRSPILRASTLVCLIGIALFGVHQYQKHLEVQQAKSDFKYAMSKMQYAVHKTGLAVNDSFGSLKVDEAPRRAFKSTSNISSALDKSLNILNHLTGNVPDVQRSQNSDTSKQPTGIQ